MGKAVVMPWLAKASTMGVLTPSSANVLGSAGFGSVATGSVVSGFVTPDDAAWSMSWSFVVLSRTPGFGKHRECVRGGPVKRHRRRDSMSRDSPIVPAGREACRHQGWVATLGSS